MTISQAARVLGITRSRVYKLLETGRLASYRDEFSGRLYVIGSDLLAFEALARKSGRPAGQSRHIL